MDGCSRTSPTKPLTAGLSNSSWDAAAHSWILIPDHEDPQGVAAGDREGGAEEETSDPAPLHSSLTGQNADRSGITDQDTEANVPYDPSIDASSSLACSELLTADWGEDGLPALVHWLSSEPSSPKLQLNSVHDDAQFYNSSGWGRPLAVVAVLLASHAAALLLGIMIGRHHTSSSESILVHGATLARRFSSGPFGTHARLCMA